MVFIIFHIHWQRDEQVFRLQACSVQIFQRKQIIPLSLEASSLFTKNKQTYEWQLHGHNIWISCSSVLIFSSSCLLALTLCIHHFKHFGVVCSNYVCCLTKSKRRDRDTCFSLFLTHSIHHSWKLYYLIKTKRIFIHLYIF